LATPVLLSLPVARAAAEQRFPPPDLGPDYVAPILQTPAPRSLLLEHLDIAVLCLALAAAAYLVHRQRSRRGLVWLSLFSLAYFGFWREGCVCAIGSLQNVALAVFDPGYAAPLAVVAFFLAPLAFVLLFGRVFCAAVCPHGALQEAVLVWPVRVPRWLEDGLRMVRHAYLALAVVLAATGAAFVVCEYDPFVGIFRLSGTTPMLVFGGSLVLLSMFVGRPYCRYLCPYGALLSMLAPLARWRLGIFTDRCVQCRLCEESCPYEAIDVPTESLRAPQRAAGRKRIRLILALLPVVLLASGAAGHLVGEPLARTHEAVRLGDALAAVERGEALDAVAEDQIEAFRRAARSTSEVTAEADATEARVRAGAMVGGLWLGLLFWAKLLSLSGWRRREDYEADPGHCVACGRCYDRCPEEKAAAPARPLAAGVLPGAPASTRTDEPPSRKAIRRAADLSAALSAVFCLVVATLLLFNSPAAEEPSILAPPEALTEAKRSLASAPAGADTVDLEERVRALDLELRSAHFRGRALSETGGTLLVFGLVIFFLALRIGSSLRTSPEAPTEPQAPDSARRRKRQGRWSVAATGGLLLASSFAVAGALRAPERAVPAAVEHGGAEARWPRFRGPGGAGRTALTEVPLDFDVETGRNVVWRAPVPLAGAGSPVVWDGRVYAVGANKDRRAIFAFDAATGDTLWRYEAGELRTSPKEAPEVYERDVFAASTPATDGKRVYAIFANGDLHAVDRAGRRVWAHALGLPQNQWGHASSPIIWRDQLIVPFDQTGPSGDLSSLRSYDAATGRLSWKRERDVEASWTTPFVADGPEGPRLVTAAPPWVIEYDAATGEEIWRSKQLGGFATPSPVLAGELVVGVMEGHGIFALRRGGRGDVTESHTAWVREVGSLPDVASPVSNGALVFTVSSSGRLSCFDLKSGERLWTHRIGGSTYVSPSLVGDRLLLFTRKGRALVMAAEGNPRVLGEASLAGLKMSASPAFARVGGEARMFLRTEGQLLCIGAP